MSNQPVSAEQQAQKAAKNVQTLNASGTIMVTRTGAIYFDLNGKSREHIAHLDSMAQDIADFAGGRVEHGVIHPLTSSPATLMIQLTDARTNGAQSIFHSLARTGNAYVFTPLNRGQSLLSFSGEYNVHELRAVAEGCNLLKPKQNTGAFADPDQNLLDRVRNAVALSAETSGDGVFSEPQILVPNSLYDRDPVKAVIVQAYLQATAESNRCQYRTENFVNKADNRYIAVHSVTGNFAVQEIMGRLSHFDVALDSDKRGAVISDMMKYSTVAKTPIVRPRAEGAGNIMRELGIGGDGIDAFGVNLGFYSSQNPK